MTDTTEQQDAAYEKMRLDFYAAKFSEDDLDWLREAAATFRRDGYGNKIWMWIDFAATAEADRRGRPIEAHRPTLDCTEWSNSEIGDALLTITSTIKATGFSTTIMQFILALQEKLVAWAVYRLKKGK